jgi:DNA primase catalytic subunit
MITLSQILKHYRRGDIQKAIVENAKDKEIAIKFGDKGFGKRPDILKYPKDVLELAKQGATSFHASEELWKNPLQLDPMMKRKDIENLRIGWDLVLDIDSIDFEFSKIITDLIINALRMHGVKSISCKFSGNKGFHIGVPFEAFPTEINGSESRLLFPEGVRRIAEYLIYFIDSEEMGLAFTKKLLERTEGDKEDIIKKIGKKKDDVMKKVCRSCKKTIPQKEINYYYGCNKCGYTEKSSLSLTAIKCKKCSSLMRRVDRMGTVTKTKDFAEAKGKETCPFCNSYEVYSHIDPSVFIDVDTLLITSRHLYRMAYSLNEKSGLVSVPLNPNRVMQFRKEVAAPKNVRVSKYRFLGRNAEKNETKKLLVQAFDFSSKKEDVKEERTYEVPEEAIPEQFFPPCIKQILKGVTDGRKRSLFILANFLTAVGWGYEQIEALLEEWNKKNAEPLREVLLKGQVRYHKQKGKKMPPPNCENSMYYKDFRVCVPDNLCQKIKNPVNYARIKTRYLVKKKK